MSYLGTMKFWFSGEVQVDVAEGYRVARNEVQEALNDALGGTSYGPRGVGGSQGRQARRARARHAGPRTSEAMDSRELTWRGR